MKLIKNKNEFLLGRKEKHITFAYKYYRESKREKRKFKK